MDYYLGEIRIFSFGMIPSGWHVCDGTILPVQQNQALFALIGNKYGGNGTTNFALPDLRGRTLVGSDQRNLEYNIGKQGGLESATLTSTNVPIHTHSMEMANTPGAVGISTNRPAIPTTPATVSPAVSANIYTTDISSSTFLAADTLDSAGGSTPHNNMQPFQVISYCIAIQGLWPSRP